MNPELRGRAEHVKSQLREKSDEELISSINNNLQKKIEDTKDLITKINDYQYKRQNISGELVW